MYTEALRHKYIMDILAITLFSVENDAQYCTRCI